MWGLQATGQNLLNNTRDRSSTQQEPLGRDPVFAEFQASPDRRGEMPSPGNLAQSERQSPALPSTMTTRRSDCEGLHCRSSWARTPPEARASRPDRADRLPKRVGAEGPSTVDPLADGPPRSPDHLHADAAPIAEQFDSPYEQTITQLPTRLEECIVSAISGRARPSGRRHFYLMITP
jgi:hypothetical protein